MSVKIGTVLIANDDAIVRAALSTRLSLAGFQVVTAPDGNAAIEALRRHRVDAAVLEVQMPDVDGFGVCQHIRSEPDLRGIPVLFLAGRATGIVRRYLAKLSECVGGDYCLTEARDEELLPGVVRRAIDRGAQSHPRDRLANSASSA